MIGSQDKKRAALKTRLSNLWNSEPEVSYNMNLRSGLFRVAVSEDEVTGFLDGKPIKSIRIEDLDDEIREALEKDPEAAGALIIEELINAHKEGKLAMTEETKLKKEAKAGENNYEDQLSGVTQRQLDDAGPLYDRQDDEREDVTEKQLGDKSYKEYENTARVDEEQKSITEKQIEEGKNPNPDTSPREDDERNSITQKQLEGSGVSTRRDDEKTDITQKQLEKDFRNDEIKGITQKQLAGDEQEHDKVLVRRLASKEEAIEFARKVAKATARKVKSNDLDTDETITILKASVKNFSAQKKLSTRLAQMMAPDMGGAPENLDMEAPEDVAGDILSDEEVGGSYESELVVNVLKSLVDNPKFPELVNEALAEDEAGEEEALPEDDVLMDEALGDLGGAPEGEPAMPMASTEDDEIVEAGKLPPGLQEYQDKKNGKETKDDDKDDKKDNKKKKKPGVPDGTGPGKDSKKCPFNKEDEDEDDSKEASSDDDGLVAVEGSLEELKKAAGENDLETIAFDFSRKAAGEELTEEMSDLLFEVDEDNNIYRAIFINSDIADMESEEVKGLMAKRESARVEKVAASLSRLETTAQSMPAGGGVPGMAPGGAPAGGGTTLPPGPADMGLDTPPVESFDTDMGEGGAEDISGDAEPSPPGTRCPVCGSDDVDVENGAFECNNCQSNGDISISMAVKEWAGTLEDNEGPNADEDEGLGEGIDMGEEAPMPMAASVYRINQGIIKEAINSGKGYINVGEHCPNCGSDNTEVDHVGNGRCFSCSQLYISKIAHKEGEFKGLTIWQPTPVKPECPDCEAKAKGVALAKKYPVNFVKTASKDDFPYAECVSKISKRYGLNAVALSGDCAGKPLIDCVCKKMKSAKRYSQSLMMALASRLTEKDPMEECIEDHMRDASKKLSIKEACVECEKLKNEALASMPEQEELEFVACQDMGNEACMGLGTGPEGGDGAGFGGGQPDGFGGDNDGLGGGGFGLSYDIDSFEDDMVTLSPEDELLEQIRSLLEVMREFLGDKGIGQGEEVGIVLDEGGEDGFGEDSVDEIIEDPEVIVDDEPSFDGGDDDDDEGGDDDEVDFVRDEDGDDDDGDDDDDDDDDPSDGGDDDDDDDDEEEENDNPFEEASTRDNDERDEITEKQLKGKGEKNSSSEEGEKTANTNNDTNTNKEGNVMDLDTVAKQMSSKTIKRYSEGDVLTTADTMQINDLLGDRKISDTPAEKEVDRVTSQDTKDVGKVQDGKTMGAEEKFDAKDPDVPERGSGSTMGEGEEMPEGKAKIPAGEGAMRKEDEIVDTNVSTEADGRLASNATDVVTAGEKTVEDPKPVDQSKDLKNQKLKDTMEMGAERETGLTPDTLEEPDVPTDNQLMGPDESKDMQKPSVPAGDGGMGHEDETVGTDVSVETKGTTIAQMEAQIKEATVKAERVKLATNLAALELMDGEIIQDEFETEASKLATSSVQTLKTLIERYQKSRAKRLAEGSKIARTEETVRDAQSVGLETPLVIEGQSGDLKDQIKSMFSLEKQIQGFEKNE